MKTILLFMLVIGSRLLAVPVGESNTDEYRRKLDREREQQIQELAQECSRSIDMADDLPADQSIPIYGYVLMRLGGWQRPDTLAVYQKAQSKLLSIPGHAAYYRDKINAGKELVRSGEMTIDRWRRLLMDAFAILRHMPSEETVEVLAEFGRDKFGRSWSKDPRDFKDVPALHGLNDDLSTAGMGVIDTPAYLALDALGIEPPPYQDRARVSDLDLERLWSQWWQDVKSGKRKYRFKGSTVEHPIHAPPGAGREARRPERRPESRDGADTGENRQSSAGESGQATKEPSHWLWIAGISAVMLAVLAYFLRGRRPIS